MVAFDDLAYHITSQSEDERLLGCWSIATITVKNDLTNTLITCYYPVVSDSSGSAYDQQLIYMSEKSKIIPKNITYPRILFGHDFPKARDKYISQGYQMIVSGDFNSKYKGLTEWFMNEGLQDII